MSGPRCLVVGAGRVAGGFVAPMLRAAGWTVTLACRDEEIRASIAERGGLRLSVVGDASSDAWIDGVDAVSLDDASLPALAAGVDLIATAVGPSSLDAVGTLLAPLLRARLETSGRPVNIVTFENHRRAPERLMTALITADATLATEIGRRIGLGGSAVWRIVARREVTGDGVRFYGNDEDECYVDAIGLLSGLPPHDNSLPGVSLVRGFDDRMVEKLWLFNAGHCAAAYGGWLAGHATIAKAMADPAVRVGVEAVVAEASQAMAAYVAGRPGSRPIPARSVASILARYADERLDDPVGRVAREPRRKLAHHDRLIGPAVTCTASGLKPVALAAAAAQALAFEDVTDRQSVDLQRDVRLVGPAEVLSMVSGLHSLDEVSRLICEAYAGRANAGEPT